MTKSSMFAPSNSIGPCTRSSNRVDAVGHAEPDGARLPVALARGDLVGREPAAGAIVAPGAAGRFGGLALRLQLLGRAVAVVRVAAGDEPLAPSRGSDRAAPTGSTGRSGPPTIGPSSQSRPSQRRPSRMPSTMSADDRSTSVSSMRRTNDAAMAAREQPVEERRAGAADVEVAGRRRREADANHPAIVVAGKFPFRAAGRVRGRRFRRSSRGRECRSPGRATWAPRLPCR